MTRLALANPQVSFALSLTTQAFVTPGDGDYYSAIYAIYGKQLAASLFLLKIFTIKSVSPVILHRRFSACNSFASDFLRERRFIRSQICSVRLEQASKKTHMWENSHLYSKYKHRAK